MQAPGKRAAIDKTSLFLKSAGAESSNNPQHTMPTERSYADRLGRAQLMQGKIALFTPAFAPADTNLTAGNFAAYCNTVEAACDETAIALDAWRTVVKERQDLVKEMKAIKNAAKSQYGQTSQQYAQVKGIKL